MEHAQALLTELILQVNYTLQNQQDYKRLLYSIDRLIRNGFSDEVILKHLSNADLTVLSPKTLPEAFWEESLLKPNTFYFHSALQLTAPSRRFSVTKQCFEKAEAFYLEPKIRFTVSDCLNYFYSALHTPYVLQQEKKDNGALSHLLKKYNSFNIEKMKVQSIDYILFLIDFVKGQEDVNPYLSLFDCENKYGAKALSQFIWQVTQSVTSGHGHCIYKGGFS